jgi:plastocyanin
MTVRPTALLALACAVVALLAVTVTAPADAARKRAAKPRQLAPKALCARSAKRAVRPRRRAAPRKVCARFGGRVLQGSARTSLIGVPGAFAAPAPFKAPAAALPVESAVPEATPTPEPPPAELPPIYSNPYAVQVQAFEFRFQLSKSTVSAGSVRVEFNLKAAEDPHNLFLVRSDGSGPLHSFDEEPSGAVTAKYLPLTGGKWTLFCSLEGHEALGMKTTLNVVD